MLITMMSSKIHRAAVTHIDMHYEGSLGIDHGLIDMAGLMVGQQIDVLNVANGARFTTYIIGEEAGSGRIGVYGAAAHLANPGDRLIIIAYAQMEREAARNFRSKVIVCDEKNNVVKA